MKVSFRVPVKESVRTLFGVVVTREIEAVELEKDIVQESGVDAFLFK